MLRAGVRPDIAERVLGHAIPSVAGVYDRYDYIEEKGKALDALASALELIINAKAATDVVRLRTGLRHKHRSVDGATDVSI